MRITHAATRALGLLALLGAALSSAVGVHAQEAAPPPQPTLLLRTEADNVNHEGVLAEYCWPVAEGDINCGASPETPASAIQVMNGDTLVIVIEGEAGAPGRLELTLIDGLDSAGEPVTVTFDDPGEETEWEVADLSEGEHAALVDAFFPDISNLSYIRYLFTLEVAAPEPTEEPTEEPTATATERPTQRATEAPTPTAEVAELTEGGEETPEELLTVEPGEAVASPTVTLIPTEVTSATETPAPSPTAPTTAEPVEGPLAGPPAVELESAGVRYGSLAVKYCWDNAAGERECPPDQVSDQPSERLVLPPISGFLIVVDGPKPDRVDLILLDAGGVTELARESRPGDVLLLYSPAAPDLGSYVFAVEAEWPEGVATYYFQIVIVPEPPAPASP